MGWLEPQIGHFAFASSNPFGIVQGSDFQGFFTGFAPTTHTPKGDGMGVGRRTGHGVFVIQVHEHEASTTFFHGLEIGKREGENAAAR